MKTCPEFVRKIEICIIMDLTAAACGRQAPSLKGLSAEEGLALYRKFTAETIAAAGREDLIRMRRAMFTRAYRVGRLLSLLPGLHTKTRKKRLIVLLYRNIGIELGDAENENPEDAGCWEILISRCSFSSAYTPVTCRVMSGFDAGVICGLFGGGGLHFKYRITEECDACRACFRKNGRS